MVPFNRLYTPQELQAASHLAPAELNAPVVDRPVRSQPSPAGRGRGLVALRQRLFGRTGPRHSAPSTT